MSCVDFEGTRRGLLAARSISATFVASDSPSKPTQDIALSFTESFFIYTIGES
jgi:hypothetical protein